MKENKVIKEVTAEMKAALKETKTTKATTKATKATTTKATKETKPVTTGRPKEDVSMNILRVNNDATLKNFQFCFRLSNLKDVDRFKRGISFYNLCSLHVDIDKRIEKLNDAKKAFEQDHAAADMKDVYEMDEYKSLVYSINEWHDLKKFISKQQAEMNLSEAEEESYKNDNFLKLTASTLCRIDVQLPHFSDTMTALNDFIPVADTGNGNDVFNSKFKALKNSLQEMADAYNTADDEHYHKSYLKVNNAMAMQIYKKSYGGCKLSKDGCYIVPNKTNEKAIAKEIVAQFTGRLQGTIANN